MTATSGREASREAPGTADPDEHERPASADRGKTVHGEAANAGHRVLAPDDAEVEAYLEVALDAPPPHREPAEPPAEPDTVVVLDFGSQFAQLIARRVRELNVYSELLPHDTPWAEIERRRPKAIILSGGPSSVYDADAPRPDPQVWSSGIPVLGICYGAHLMARELGGEVVPASHREYGPAIVSITAGNGLFDGLEADQPVWMSHGDFDHPPARRVPDHRPDGFDAVRGAGRRRAPALRHPVPPRGRPHAPWPRRAPQLRRRHRRGRADLDAGQLHRPDGCRYPGPRRRPRHGDRLGWAGDLRPLGRRGFGGRRGPRPSGGRGPADLHLRRPRPDAEEGIGAPSGHVRAEPGHAPGHGRCAAEVPGPAGRRRGSGAQAQDHRRRVHPGLRGGVRQAGPDRLPDPGNAVPGRDRECDLGDEGGGQDQDPPQRRWTAGRPAVPADRAAAVPVQGRGPFGRRRAGPARGNGPPPAISQGLASRSGSSAR